MCQGEDCGFRVFASNVVELEVVQADVVFCVARGQGSVHKKTRSAVDLPFIFAPYTLQQLFRSGHVFKQDCQLQVSLSGLTLKCIDAQGNTAVKSVVGLAADRPNYIFESCLLQIGDHVGPLAIWLSPKRGADQSQTQNKTLALGKNVRSIWFRRSFGFAP